MTEKEYLNATNLTKVNVAISVLKDACLNDGSMEDELLAVSLKAIYRITDLLNQKINVNEGM